MFLQNMSSFSLHDFISQHFVTWTYSSPPPYCPSPASDVAPGPGLGPGPGGGITPVAGAVAEAAAGAEGGGESRTM